MSNKNTKDKDTESTDVISNISKRSFLWLKTETLINCLPENRPLYKDSGLWQIRTDDMDDVYISQNVNETLRGFIVRYLEWLEEMNQCDDVWVDLSYSEDI